MKFKLALWILGFKLERASRKNPRFIDKLKGQDLIFEVGARDGYARHFVIKDQKVLSYPGKASQPVYLGPSQEPTFAIVFDTEKSGFRALSAKDRQLAMISGLQDKRITLEGNPLYLLWFQNLAKLLEQKN